MSDGTYKPIDIPPGIVTDVTEYSAEGRYTDGDKVRFTNTKAEKIGGWETETVSQATNPNQSKVVGVVRRMLAWEDFNRAQYLAIGTNKKLYVLYQGQYHDITPIVKTATVTDIFTTTSGSSEVSVSLPSHDRQVGDFVIFDGLISVGGVTIDGEYEVVSRTDLNNYTIDVGINATSSVTDGGGSVTYKNLLAVGREDNTLSKGYGAGSYDTPGETSTSGWNDPRTGTIETDLRLWSLEKWGKDLIANPRGGSIYVWEAAPGNVTTRATLIPNAPEENLAVKLSQPSRQLIALGTNRNDTNEFDPKFIRWCESENYNKWDVTSTGDAGFFQIQEGTEIETAASTKRELVIKTDVNTHVMKYIGRPFWFSVEKVGTNTGLVGPNASISINERVYWMGLNSFYVYDGVVRELESTLDKSIFDNDRDTSLNRSQKEKVYASHNTQFNEITWYYPSKNATENDRYVSFSYENNSWCYGTLDRTAWESKGVFDKPLAFSPDGILYVHEQGRNSGGAPMSAFIETAEFDLGEGDNIIYFDRLLPNSILSGSMRITVFARNFPGEDYKVSGPHTVKPGTKYISPRVRGRRFKLRFESIQTDADFALGKQQARVMPDGDR